MTARYDVDRPANQGYSVAVSLSVTEPFRHAVERTREVLLPFQLNKWLVVGFAYFLASLGEGGGSQLNLPNPSGGSGSGSGGAIPSWLKEATGWIEAHLGTAIALGAVGMLLVTAIGYLILWVSCRGKFVFLDNIAADRAAITEPWHRFRVQGNSLLWTKFLLGLLGSCAVLISLGVLVAVAWADLSAERFTSPLVIVGGVSWGMLTMLILLCLGIINWLLDDFAVIAMYRDQDRSWPALRRVVRQLVRPHLGSLLLFGVMKLLLGVAIGLCVTMLTCLTCCIAGLPYVSSVVFLPFGVFMRCYSIFFVEQIGDEWTVIQPRPPEPPEAFERWAGA